MLRRAPDWLDGHVALAQLRWETGQRETFLESFEAALKRLPGHAGLWFRYMTAIAGSGRHDRAADVARQLRGRGADSPPLRLIEAHHAGMAGEFARAGALLSSIPEEVPGKRLEQARHQLRTGNPAEAAEALDRMRATGEMDSSAWALVELAWRAAGDPRHRWLLDVEQHVGVVQIGLDGPALDALAKVLRGLHRASGYPLGQSVREGTQTRGNLWRRGEPEIERLHARLKAAVSDFASGLPQVEADHPLRSCSEGPLKLTTGWSIRLNRGGHHISHIHAHGILSSACYVAVPAETADRQGWLELGRPPSDIPLALEPLATIEPQPGRLILFPSFLYHGTRPFDAGERLTVAFDAAPTSQA